MRRPFMCSQGTPSWGTAEQPDTPTVSSSSAFRREHPYTIISASNQLKGQFWAVHLFAHMSSMKWHSLTLSSGCFLTHEDLLNHPSEAPFSWWKLVHLIWVFFFPAAGIFLFHLKFLYIFYIKFQLYNRPTKPRESGTNPCLCSLRTANVFLLHLIWYCACRSSQPKILILSLCSSN